MLRCAVTHAEDLLGHELLGNCRGRETREIGRPRVVTDNGAAFENDSFSRFVSGQPHLEHIRTRHDAAEANGAIERFNQTPKQKHLCQREIAKAPGLTVLSSISRQGAFARAGVDAVSRARAL